MSRTNLPPETVVAAQHGDKAATAALMARMEPLVVSAARKFSNGSTTPREDLEQDCWLAVFESLKTYDPDKGPFETWCFGPMRSEMSNTTAALVPGPSVPSRTLKRYFAVLSSDDRMDEVASEVHNVITGTWSLSALGGSPESEEGDDLGEFDIPQTEPEKPVGRLYAERAMVTLSARERQVLRLWTGMETGEPMTDAEVGAIIGVERSRATRIKNRALGKVRDYLEEIQREAEV